MSSSSIRTVTDDSGTVTESEMLSIEFILRLRAAATAGRKLLEAVEAGDATAGALAAEEAGAAYAQLDEIQNRATA